MSKRIGILDSGVGGLTVVKEVIRQLPLEPIVYIGDSARCPYGSRSTEEIRCFSNQMIDFLLNFDLKALVIACNTATAVILDEVKEQLHIPVVGVIEPGARAAIRATKNNSIGVIGTIATITSGMYEKVLRRTHPDLKIASLACPSFVPLVECGNVPQDAALTIIQNSLAPFRDIDFDTLILGCTHYPIISDLIQKAVGDHVTLISSAEETASEVSAILSRYNCLNSDPLSSNHLFFTSGDVTSFRAIAEHWLGTSIEVKNINLEESSYYLPHTITARII